MQNPGSSSLKIQVEFVHTERSNKKWTDKQPSPEFNNLASSVAGPTFRIDHPSTVHPNPVLDSTATVFQGHS